MNSDHSIYKQNILFFIDINDINILYSLGRDPRETSIAPVHCKLCLVEIKGIINLRAHLCSQQHTAKQRMIDTTAEFGDNLQSLMEKLRL